MLIEREKGVLTVTFEQIKPKQDQGLLSVMTYYFKLQIGNQIEHTEKFFSDQNHQKQTIVFIGEAYKHLELTMFNLILEKTNYEIGQWYISLLPYLNKNQQHLPRDLILRKTPPSINMTISWSSILSDTQSSLKSQIYSKVPKPTITKNMKKNQRKTKEKRARINNKVANDSQHDYNYNL